MEYILFIHNNSQSATQDEQWHTFFNEARKSGVFRGGSEMSNQQQIGKVLDTKITDNIAGIMRFESDDIQSILSLLDIHPVALQGGTLELCEMPRSD